MGGSQSPTGRPDRISTRLEIAATTPIGLAGTRTTGAVDLPPACFG